MTNRPRARGTAAETAVVRAARVHGFPHAERVALHGAHDVGDLLLCPGVILEIKGGDAARHATDLDVQRWLDDTDRERRNAGAAVAFLVLQRPHVGLTNAHRWHAWWRLAWLADLGPHQVPAALGDTPVRTTLGDALAILRAAGYGQPPTPSTPEPIPAREGEPR